MQPSVLRQPMRDAHVLFNKLRLLRRLRRRQLRLPQRLPPRLLRRLLHCDLAGELAYHVRGHRREEVLRLLRLRVHVHD